MPINLVNRGFVPLNAFPDTITIPFSPTAGNTIVIALVSGTGGGPTVITSIVDGLSNPFTNVPGANFDQNFAGESGTYIWYVQSCSGSTTLILNGTDPHGHLVCAWIYELSPALTLDDSGGYLNGVAGSLPNFKGPALNGTGSEDFYLNVISADESPVTVAAPWTYDTNSSLSPANGFLITAYLISNGTQQASFTQPDDPSDDTFAIGGASFKPAGSPTPDPSKSTLQFSSSGNYFPSNGVQGQNYIPADNNTTATITVTLLDSSGNPVSGKTVALSGTGGSTISPPSGSSDSNGVVTFTVKDANVEACTYTATDTTDSITLNQTATVSFFGLRVDGTVWSQQGPVVSGAHVYALDQSGIIPVVGTPETQSSTWTPITAFDDPLGQNTVSQPLVTDGFGSYAFYSGETQYTLVIVTNGVVSRVYANQEINLVPVALHRVDGWVKSNLGPAISGAQIFLLSNSFPNISPTLSRGTQLTPPNPQVNIYADAQGTQLIAQPLLSDTFGNYSFYVPAGVYTLAVYLNGVLQQVYPDQNISSTPTLVRFEIFAKDALGRAIANAPVIVCQQPAQVPQRLVPLFPSPVQQIYRDANGLVPQAQTLTYDSNGNPVITSLTTDGDGFCAFYAASGTYTVAIYNSSGVLIQLLPDQTLL